MSFSLTCSLPLFLIFPTSFHLIIVPCSLCFRKRQVFSFSPSYLFDDLLVFPGPAVILSFHMTKIPQFNFPPPSPSFLSSLAPADRQQGPDPALCA